MRLLYGGRRFTRLAAATLLGLVIAWVAGFAAFVHRAAQPTPVPPRTNGIVVLTGGEDRVQAALKLLVDGRADRLLVTGIGGGANLKDLARLTGMDARPLADRVTLGRGAASTRGNAEETAAWAAAYGIRSLIVVTAFYHMPRAVTEMRRALPSVTLYPDAVLPPGMQRGDGLGTWAGLRLMAEEYTKFLAAWVDVTAFEPGPRPRLSAAASHGAHG